MARSQELAVQQKKELALKEEKTVPAEYYVPNADIYATDDALTIVVEIPGIDKKDISVKLESDVLRIEGQVDFSNYEGLEPVYSEYNVGHFARGFTLSNKIDQDAIAVDLEEGVLTLKLRKVKGAAETYRHQVRSEPPAVVRFLCNDSRGSGRHLSCAPKSENGWERRDDGEGLLFWLPSRWIGCARSRGAKCEGVVADHGLRIDRRTRRRGHNHQAEAPEL